MSKRILTVLVAMAFIAPAAFGVTRTWNGGGNDGQWMNPANWDVNSSPATNDDIIMPTDDWFVGWGADLYGNITVPNGGFFRMNSSTELKFSSLTIDVGGRIDVTVGRIVGSAANIVNNGILGYDWLRASSDAVITYGGTGILDHISWNPPNPNSHTGQLFGEHTEAGSITLNANLDFSGLQASGVALMNPTTNGYNVIFNVFPGDLGPFDPDDYDPNLRDGANAFPDDPNIPSTMPLLPASQIVPDPIRPGASIRIGGNINFGNSVLDAAGFDSNGVDVITASGAVLGNGFNMNGSHLAPGQTFTIHSKDHGTMAAGAASDTTYWPTVDWGPYAYIDQPLRDMTGLTLIQDGTSQYISGSAPHLGLMDGVLGDGIEQHDGPETGTVYNGGPWATNGLVGTVELRSGTMLLGGFAGPPNTPGDGFPLWVINIFSTGGKIDLQGRNLYLSTQAMKDALLSSDHGGGVIDSVGGGNVIVYPEPATMTLLGLGGLALLRRRKR